MSAPRESPWTPAEIAAACRDAFGMPVKLANAMGTLAAAAMSSEVPPDALACRKEALEALAADLMQACGDLRDGTPRAVTVVQSLGLSEFLSAPDIDVAARVLAAVALMVRKRITEPLP